MTDPTPRSFGSALTRLRAHQKTSKGAPAYSLLVNRRLGRVFAAAGYVLGATPNQVTAVSALCTFSAIATIALLPASGTTAAIVTGLLVLGYALDAADGQLARLRGGGSVAGEWLDHVVDAAKISTVHLAVAIGWFRFSGRDDSLLLLPLGFSSIATTLFFVMMLNDRIRRAHRGTTDMLLAGDGSSSLAYSLAVAPTDYGLVCVMFALWGWEAGFTVVYAALLVSHALFLALALVKWYREMRQLR